MLVVIRVERCEPCQGTGRVQNAAWDLWHQAHPKPRPHWPPGRRQEYFAALTQAAHELGSDRVPCAACEGTGEVCSEVPLRDALRELRSDLSAFVQQADAELLGADPDAESLAGADDPFEDAPAAREEEA